jgi:hypothetical protein
MMADVPGVGWKPLRDCSDEEVHAIARYHSQLGTLRLFDEDWFLRHTMEAREQERNPLEGVGFFPLLGLAWSRLLLAAARRSSLARLLLRFLYRIRHRVEDRLRRDDGEDDSGSTQIAVGGSFRP